MAISSRKSGANLELSGNIYLNCYDYFGQAGDSVALVNYADDLADYGMDDRINSCCAYGM